ncbi:MAG: hypothetical protein LBB48_03520 [Treponema sp.]|nr:hypothetical protein [Treponema sp.]
MEFIIQVKRQESPNSPPYLQSFIVEDDGEAAIAAVLEELNSRTPLVDADGKTAEPIFWECSCLQRKCGACAMRINGAPKLACSQFLRDFPKRRITLEPLAKFPIVSDLIVDRSVLFKHCKEAGLWLEDKASLPERRHEALYQSARCLMCGCCLEVCPNFVCGEDFCGAALSVNAYRIFEQSGHGEHRKEMAAEYRKRYWNGCSQSLSCHEVCPVKLPVEDLLVRSNAIAVWNR